MRKNEQGFSFAELMTVIAIIGILSAIALPNFLGSLPEKRLRNATRNLYADLQKARLLAVKENRSVRVGFVTDDGDNPYNGNGNPVTSYYFEEDDEDSDEYRIRDTDEFMKRLEDYGAVTYGCDADTDDTRNVTFGNYDVTFSSTGTAKLGMVYLQSRNDQTVCYSLAVSRFGNIKIRRFTTEWGEWRGE